MKHTGVVCALVLVGPACGGGGGGASVDAPKTPIDAPVVTVDVAPVPIDGPLGSAAATITFGGVAAAESLTGTTAEAGIAIAWFKTSDDTMLGSATVTNGSGEFSITISTGGTAVDGYLKATGSAFADTYFYPPGPLTADFPDASVELLSPSLLTLIGQTTPGDAFIGCDVFDGSGGHIQGATVNADTGDHANGTVEYDAGGSPALPSKSNTSTGADGTSYVFNITPGTVMVSGSKSGATFGYHPVKTYANSVTETIVQQ